MSLELRSFTAPLLAADASVAEGVVTARFRGTADVESKPELDEFVRQLHEHSKSNGITKVIADFRELKFMNSSSFKIFVTWLALVQELPEDVRYRVHFLSNPNLHWQRRSLAALSCFAVELVTIET